jgi:DNA replication protein DnaC
MNPDLTETLKYLRLGGLLAHWDEYLKLAAEKRFSHTHLLTHVVEEECRLRRENARLQRLRCARIPEHFVIETFPFERQPKLNKKRIMALYESPSYIQQGQNIIWLGPPSRGKTGLATSFLIHAINQGYSGRYVRFSDLVAELYSAFDALLIDEIGFVEVEPVQVGLFFTLMQRRHKKKSTLITSNLGFGEWHTFLKNNHLTAALLERLSESSYVFNLKDCVGIRPKLSQDP